MTKIRLLTISVIALFLLNTATLFILYSTRHDSTDRRRPGNGQPAAQYIINRLQLDEQQQQQFAVLRNDHHAFVEKAEQENRRLHDLYFGMLKDSTRDPGKIDSIATLIGEQRKQLAQKTFTHFQQLRAICRADQQSLFDTAIDEITSIIAAPHPPPPGGRPPRRE